MKTTVFDSAFWNNLCRSITERALESTVHVIGIVIVYFVLRNVCKRMVDSITAGIIAREVRLGVTEERSGRLKTLSSLFNSMIGYVLFFVFVVLIFKAVGFDIMPFITTASVVGLAVGFGAQKLVKDVISGFFIIVDNMFVVGDTITVGTVTGQVQDMGMRVTRLLDATGRVILLSNGDIGQVINLSRNPVQEFIEVALAAGSDLNVARSAVNAAGKALIDAGDTALKAAPELTGVSAFTAASVTVRISVASDPRCLVQEQMRVRSAVRDALAKAGIQPA
jgi:moderate conductance mechanosensitive channel